MCWAQRSQTAFAAGKWDTASAELGRARVFLPGDPIIVQSLARVEFNRGVDFANGGACDEARPHLMAAMRDEPVLGEKVTSALGGCAGQRANKAAVAGDWVLALAEVRRGLHDAPQDDGLRQNLAIALHNHATVLLTARRCDELRLLLPELDASDARLMSGVRQACP